MDRARTCGVIVCLFAAAALLGAPSPSAAETFTSEEYGYSLEVPDGWETIDPSEAPERFGRMAEILDGESGKSEGVPPTQVDLVASLGGPPATAGSPSLGVFVAEEPGAFNASKIMEVIRSQLIKQIEQRGEKPNVREMYIDRELEEVEPWDVVVGRDNVEAMAVFEESWGYNVSWIKQGKNYSATLMFMVPTDQWESTAEARRTLFESYELPDGEQAKHDTARKVGRLLGYFGCMLLLPLGLGIWWWRSRES